MRKTWFNALALTLVALLAASGAAFAQSQSGNLYGTAADNEGAPLPGVRLTLSGGGAPQTQFSDAQGEFRFLGLSPGSYSLEASLEGFSTVSYPKISINVGRNTTIAVKLSPAIEETITVTSESPLLDERKISTGATVAQVELEKVPSARDPWAILQTVPGVKTDRINVGGNESGQQSQYTGPGSSGDDAVWAIDGVTITDMGAIGSSPTYYNFDAFQEVQASTGGSDITAATSGVQLNMVTRRGTNEFRGSGRFFRADDGWQSSGDLGAGELGRDYDGAGPVGTQAPFKQGNRIVQVDDFGAELGGPIVKDRLWIWANYGRNEVDLLTIQDVSDFTLLETYGAKLNGQLGASNSLVAFYNYGDKIKNGRNAGPTRPQETTWNQTGPTDIYKLEDTQVFSSSFYLTGLASYVGGGFQLTPQGGVDDGPAIALDLDTFIWHDNFFHHETDRPQEQAKIDANYFFSTGSVGHDLKFGVGYRDVNLSSTSRWPGDGVRYTIGPTTADTFYFKAARTTQNDTDTQYTSLYLQDTLTFGNLTLNAGLRYDRQEGEQNAVTVAGVPGFEEFGLIDASFPGQDQGFTWTDISPRLGVTWALGADRKTLLRASYSRFAEQLRQGYSSFNQPLAPGNYSYAYFYAEDDNLDGFISIGEIDEFVGTNGFDPTGQVSLNRIDPDFEAALTDELILSVEHALLPEFVIGATVTLRNINNLAVAEGGLTGRRLVIDPTATSGCIEVTADGCLRPAVRSDYVFNRNLTSTLPDGTPVSVPYFTINPNLTDTGGFYLTNGDREQDYRGLSLTANKRLSNNWMLRASVTFEDWEWDIPASDVADPNVYLGGAEVDGGAVLQGSGTGSGSKGAIYISSGWSYSITGMYQIAPERPWGFNVSAAINGREGYPIPYFIGRVSGFTSGSLNNNIQATADVEDFRNDDVHIFDARIEKEFTFGNFDFTVSADVFNLFNETTVLQRQHRLSRSNSDHVQEVVSPRILRLGVRFGIN